MTIDASLNEVEGLAAKAARGAGLAWGLAEDTARAAHWLAAAGFDWGASLAALLGEHASLAAPLAGLPVLRPARADDVLSPLLTGTYLDDICAAVGTAETTAIAHPLWLLPFAARSGAVVGWDGLTVATAAARLTVGGDRAKLSTARTARVTWQRPAVTSHPGVATAPAGRSRVPAAAWQQLLRFAARTYVPASELSRARGAGAGLVDND